MDKDLAPMLEGWDYRPGEVSVRRILGADNKEKIQMRLELGLLQMETTGRPDGKRPHGMESLLEYCLSRLEQHQALHGGSEGFQLSPEDCNDLRNESLQYYYRYLSLFHLQDFEGVKRDTDRNLRVFDLIKEYAAEEADKFSLEQYRPYVIMMNTRAKAHIHLRRRQRTEALLRIEEGISRIRAFFEEYGQADLADKAVEMIILKSMAEEVAKSTPLDPLDQLKEELRRAVEGEDFERAARLRDQIRGLEEKG